MNVVKTRPIHSMSIRLRLKLIEKNVWKRFAHEFRPFSKRGMEIFISDKEILNYILKTKVHKRGTQRNFQRTI